MAEGREIARADDEPEGSDEAPRKVHVGPEDVFQPGETPPSPRWRQRSFFAPILLVVLISAVLVYGGIVVLGLVWRLLR